MKPIVPGQLIKINATILPKKNWATMAEQGLQCTDSLIFFQLSEYALKSFMDCVPLKNVGLPQQAHHVESTCNWGG